MIPHILGVVLLCIIMSAFAVDCGVTVTTILKFNKRLKVMDEMAAKIHKLSDEIGENIYENVTTAVENRRSSRKHMRNSHKISDTKEKSYGSAIHCKREDRFYCSKCQRKTF